MFDLIRENDLAPSSGPSQTARTATLPVAAANISQSDSLFKSPTNVRDGSFVLRPPPWPADERRISGPPMA